MQRAIQQINERQSPSRQLHHYSIHLSRHMLHYVRPLLLQSTTFAMRFDMLLSMLVIHTSTTRDQRTFPSR